jgi:hypothetical protein
MPFFRELIARGAGWVANGRHQFPAAVLSILVKFEFQERISIAAGAGYVTDAHGLSPCTYCQALFEGLQLSVSGLCSLKSNQKRYYLRALLCPAAKDDRGLNDGL